MASATQQHFDFSLDAQAFQEKLARKLQFTNASQAIALDDDDLEFVNAAGVAQPVHRDEKSDRPQPL